MRIVPPHELANEWPRVSPWIEEAMAYGQGDENLLDVLLGISRGQYLLWADERFAGVVQICQFPRQRVATVLYAGGDLEAMKAAIQTEGYPWCKSTGIDVLRIWGRKGWERALGMSRKGVIMQLDFRAQGSLQ